MVHRRPLTAHWACKGQMGLRDAPGHTSRSLQRTNVYNVKKWKSVVFSKSLWNTTSKMLLSGQNSTNHMHILHKNHRKNGGFHHHIPFTKSCTISRKNHVPLNPGENKHQFLFFSAIDACNKGYFHNPWWISISSWIVFEDKRFKNCWRRPLCTLEHHWYLHRQTSSHRCRPVRIHNLLVVESVDLSGPCCYKSNTFGEIGVSKSTKPKGRLRSESEFPMVNQEFLWLLTVLDSSGISLIQHMTSNAHWHRHQFLEGFHVCQIMFRPGERLCTAWSHRMVWVRSLTRHGEMIRNNDYCLATVPKGLKEPIQTAAKWTNQSFKQQTYTVDEQDIVPVRMVKKETTVTKTANHRIVMGYFSQLAPSYVTIPGLWIQPCESLTAGRM